MSGSSAIAVLGAGFSRAFVPAAPLLIDDYGVSTILDAFEHFPHASRVLRSSVLSDGRVNVEALLTRLDGALPYDIEQGAAPELSLLLTAIMNRFRERVTEARLAERDDPGLSKFAKWCVDQSLTCITFNYDDLLDEALWKCKGVLNVVEEGYWHPDGGYGFFCRPSKTLIREGGMTGGVVMDTTCMLLLKLHGSMNWRIRRGCSRPLAIDDVVHDEEWLPASNDFGDFEGDVVTPEIVLRERAAISDHLEKDPFIIPPVLTKGSLVDEPILRLIWSSAFNALRSAETVFFLGYSMPPTDIASQHLFREAIDARAQIHVVNYTADGEPDEELISSYRRVFPDLPTSAFRFSGIVSWVDEVTADEAKVGPETGQATAV